MRQYNCSSVKNPQYFLLVQRESVLQQMVTFVGMLARTSGKVLINAHDSSGSDKRER